MRTRSLGALGALFLTTLAAQPFLASEAAAQQNLGTIVLDPFLTEQADPLSGAADRATSVYVAGAEAERAALGNLRDLFAGIASASVGGAIPVAQKIFVNGVDMLNLSITVDGVMQNNRTFHHVSASAVDPGLLRFVRVDPGIAAADTGPNALAGAVVMETIDASEFLMDGQNFGGQARLRYSDNGGTFAGALTLAGQADGFEWLLYGRRDTGEDYTNGNGIEQHGTAADLFSGLANIAYESDTGHRFEFSAQIMNDSAFRAWRANIGDIIGGTSGDVRLYDTERTSYSLRYSNTQAFGLWDPEVTLGFSENQVNVPDPWGSEGTTNTYSATLQNTFNLNERDTITAGFDYFDRTSTYVGPGVSFEENAVNLGAFAQARFEPVDGLDISTGLRYDVRDFTGITGFTDTISGVSGNFSATYHFTEQFSARAGYSNVFGGIDVTDNYVFWFGWDYSALQPTRSENISVGFDWVGPRLSVGGEFFRTEIEDARYRTTNFDFTTSGFNLGITYDWDSGFARLTYNNTEVEYNGGAPNSYFLRDVGTPIGQVLAFEMQQELPAQNLIVGGSLDVVLDYDGTGGLPDVVDLPGYEVLNLFAEWHSPRHEGLVVRASVDNVFDTAFWDRATYGGDFANGMVFGVEPIYEPGRTFSLEVVRRF